MGVGNDKQVQTHHLAFNRASIEKYGLQGARIERMAIVGGRVTELLVAESTLVDVDLRGANLESVVPATGLAGATISLPQALDLATGLAAGLGIDVR